MENYVSSSEKFEGEEQINKRVGMNFFACKDSTFTIDGKCKQILIEGCKKCVFYVDQVVSEISVMNCTNVKIFAKTAVNTVTIESSSEVGINLTNKTRKCMVVTTCTRSVTVIYPKEGCSDESVEGEDWVHMPVAETFESHIQGNALETKPMENLE